MKKHKPTLLLHPFFIICLGLLLVNDFLLKPLLHDWLTGKLSDFSGLAAFAIFFNAIFPTRKKTVYILTGLLFIWWKTPLSQPLIEACSDFFNIGFGRVVDYSDYLALTILPFAWQIKPINDGSFFKWMATRALGGISIFAFCATELPYRYLPMSDTSFGVYRNYPTLLTDQQIGQRLDSMHLHYIKDSFEAYPEAYFETYDHGYFHYGPPQFFYTQRDSAADTLKVVPLHGASPTNIYRRYATGPFYMIRNATIGGETIPAIKIRLLRNVYTGSYIQLSEIELTKKQEKAHLYRPHKTEKRYREAIYNQLIQKLVR